MLRVTVNKDNKGHFCLDVCLCKRFLTFVAITPVAGGGAGGAQAPPEIFRLELIFAITVEFWY